MWTADEKPGNSLQIKLEVILSIQVIFQLNSDYCTNVVYRGLALYHTELWSLPLLLKRHYKLELTGRSVQYGNVLLRMVSLVHVFSKNTISKTSTQILYMVVFLSITQCKPQLSQPLSFPTVFVDFQAAYYENTCQFYITQ